MKFFRSKKRTEVYASFPTIEGGPPEAVVKLQEDPEEREGLRESTERMVKRLRDKLENKA